MQTAEITIAAVAGAELADLIAALAELRIRIFADYPYRYAGSSAYEARYLDQFAKAPHALVVTASDSNGHIVGCATGSALAGHHPEFSAPLAAAGYDLDSTFYFGESVLDPEWRGLGIGHQFFAAREDHARRLGYKRACFCAVVRPPQDPHRPQDYRPLDDFWRGRGYRRLAGVQASYDWPEVAHGPAIPHPMAYWLREF